MVKVPNSKLVWMVIGMVAFELLILFVWTSVSPLRPITYLTPTNQLDGAMNEITHCSVDAKGMAFVGVEATFKGVLLIFGTLMGFSTRKVVSTFNEAGTLAYAIYNVVFSSIICAAIIVFLNTLGETLIILVLFLLLWIIYCTWAFLFVPKVMAIMSADENGVAKILELSNSAGGSAATQSGSGMNSTWSLANVATMTLTQLTPYLKALEKQVDRVKRRVHHLSGTVAGHEKEETHVLLGKQQRAGSGVVADAIDEPSQSRGRRGGRAASPAAMPAGRSTTTEPSSPSPHTASLGITAVPFDASRGGANDAALKMALANGIGRSTPSAAQDASSTTRKYSRVPGLNTLPSPDVSPPKTSHASPVSTLPTLAESSSILSLAASADSAGVPASSDTHAYDAEVAAVLASSAYAAATAAAAAAAVTPAAGDMPAPRSPSPMSPLSPTRIAQSNAAKPSSRAVPRS